MAVTAQYVLPHRRRREKLTDYRLRLKLSRSGKLRVVIRKSGSHVSIGFVKLEPSGDKTLLTVSSAHLSRFGWGAGTGNTSAAYLTGLLAGKLALSMGMADGIIDLGLQTSTKGSRLYAAVKGLLDAGFKLPCDASMLPDEKRVRGEHIASWGPKVAKPSFSTYKIRPADLPKHFDEVKKKIEVAKK